MDWKRLLAYIAEIVRVVESDENRSFAGEIETLNGHLKPIVSGNDHAGWVNDAFRLQQRTLHSPQKDAAGGEFALRRRTERPRGRVALVSRDSRTRTGGPSANPGQSGFCD